MCNTVPEKTHGDPGVLKTLLHIAFMHDLVHLPAEWQGWTNINPKEPLSFSLRAYCLSFRPINNLGILKWHTNYIVLSRKLPTVCILRAILCPHSSIASSIPDPQTRRR